MFLNCLFLPYLQAQTVGFPVTTPSPNVRLMRSALVPQAPAGEAFSFAAPGCPAEAAFMEEECVDTPKVRPAGRPEGSGGSAGAGLGLC